MIMITDSIVFFTPSLNNIFDPCSRVLKNLQNIQATATATAPATVQEPFPAGCQIVLVRHFGELSSRKVTSR